MSAVDAEDEALVCPICGCRDFQALLWVEVSSRQIVEDGDDLEATAYCPSCDSDFRVSALRCV